MHHKGVTPDPSNAPETLRLRADGLLWREIEGEIVAVDTSSSEYLAVNRSGVSLWRDLVEGTTVERMRNGLVERYGLDSARAAADVEAFVKLLRARNLLVERDASGGP